MKFMEVKVSCDCGQKYKFDVEPVNGQMPVTVSCPHCGVDGTSTANNVIAQTFSSQQTPIPVAMAIPVAAAAPVGGLRINQTAPVPPNSPPPLAAPTRPVPMRPVAPVVQNVKPVNEFNLGLGIVGAVLGAALGAGLMYGFFILADFRFPLMGTGIGALTGLGARILYKGTATSLGIISGSIALLATLGTLYLMYGDMAGMFILSMIVSVYFAYKIAG
jgi:hypothetical protein